MEGFFSLQRVYTKTTNGEAMSWYYYWIGVGLQAPNHLICPWGVEVSTAPGRTYN
jgi:hypothetical protein